MLNKREKKELKKINAAKEKAHKKFEALLNIGSGGTTDNGYAQLFRLISTIILNYIYRTIALLLVSPSIADNTHVTMLFGPAPRVLCNQLRPSVSLSVCQ